MASMWGRRGPTMGIAVVRGRSMQPTLQDGDRLLVSYGAAPRPGRLVIVRLPDRPIAVKRAVRRMPQGWWVERDNPENGVDSWLVGPVADDDVLGCVLVRLWPWRVAWLQHAWARRRRTRR